MENNNERLESIEDKIDYEIENNKGEQVKHIKVNKSKKYQKAISIILILLLSVGAGFGGGLAALYYGQDLIPGLTVKNDITIKPVGNVNTAEAVAEKVIPSVVGIST